jgi:hypothetical protein
MPRFLDTTGLTSLAIAVCDRCKMKRAYANLGPDPNFPGLRVCDQGCKDEFDPYRLPARKTERINLRFPRPDVSVANVQPALQTGGYGQFLISTQGNQDNPETNGNLDVISPSE